MTGQLLPISFDRPLLERLRIYCLLSLVTLFFLPSVFGEFVSLDDLDLVNYLAQTEQLDFYQLYFGERTGGLYYRPLLMTTHYLEKIFLTVDPRIMRFNNVLLQLANSLFVYLIVRKIYAIKGRCAGWWPLLWSLLFGLHPLVSESVNWVSGRTDLLAGFFVLASTWLLLKYKQNNSLLVLTVSLIAAFCAMLSKEVAVAFVPGFFLLLSIKSDKTLFVSKSKVLFTRLAGAVCCLILALGLLIYLRSLSIVSSHDSISRTVQAFWGDSFYSAMLFFRLFGFYFKKLLAPWPLNLAIVDVDPLYDLLGVVVILVLLWLFFRHRIDTDYFIVAALLILPAYPISFGQVAWTPYAERYAYVALAFFLLGCASLVAENHSAAGYKRVVGATIVSLLLLFVPTTYARNITWQSSVSLWAETVKTSPYSVESHSNYGVALYKVGDFAAAEVQFDLARSGVGYNYDPKKSLVYGQLLFESGRHSEAVNAWREVVTKTNGKSSLALSEVVTQCSRSAYMTRLCGGYEPVSLEFSRLYEITSDPVWIVKWADFAQREGQQVSALNLYRQAKQLLPEHHPLRPAVEKIIGVD